MNKFKYYQRKHSWENRNVIYRSKGEIVEICNPIGLWRSGIVKSIYPHYQQISRDAARKQFPLAFKKK